MYIISDCLLGCNCKYTGGNNLCDWVCDFAKEHDYIAVCPEIMGGLAAPRQPCERQGDLVVCKDGTDVTEAFYRGAAAALEAAEARSKELGKPIMGAILKARSPSCGSDIIYDGTFSGVLIEGDGVLSELLKKHDIKVITEQERGNI